MTDTDIPALIEELQHLEEGMIGPPYNHDEDAKIVRRAIEALSRLSVSPLPGEIAGLIDALEKTAATCPLRAKAAAALERMARAYEVLKSDCAECFAQNEQYAARIRELETERADRIAELALRLQDAATDVRNIKAKTIEECAAAKIAMPPGQFATASDEFLLGFQMGAEAQIEAICALNHPAGDGNPSTNAQETP